MEMQPINEMNVASGCPKFAPLSILTTHPTSKIFLKCKMDIAGIEVTANSTSINSSLYSWKHAWVQDTLRRH